MPLARWGSEAILKYVADAPLSRLTEAYLEKVQSATVAVLGSVPDAPSQLSAAPLCGTDALALADDSANALLSANSVGSVPFRFAANDSAGSRFVHVIAARQAWERPKPGRTICGWDYLSCSAPVFQCVPVGFKRCGKCASVATWAHFEESVSDSD